MGWLTEASFTERVQRGCTACGSKKLLIRAYVEARLPLMEGEPVGPVAWAYKGETFVDGVFDMRCASCASELYTNSACPRCGDAGGLARALDSENRHAVPAACPTCDHVMLTYRALVPARVTYEGKRADKARTSTGLYDPGFHGLGVDCKTCGTFARQTGACALCAGPNGKAT